MSHSVVIVTLAPGEKVEDRLEAALAPFYEGLDVEPYRDYISGEPGKYWSWDENPEIPEPTWLQVAEAYNAKYGASDGEMQVAEDGRAYTMSTYNPKSKWDWYQIGGRWTGYFRVRPEWIGDENLINGQPGTMTARNTDREKCDGGPKRMLDFEAMRDWAEVDEGAKWKQFHAIADQHPDTRPWAHFVQRVHDENDPLTIEQARVEYHEQPGYAALHDTDFRWYDDPYQVFSPDLATFQAIARRDAVPGWSLLTLDGQWREKGHMGWFGMSDATEDSTAAYKTWANEYLESLDDDVILVAVDVHI